MSRNTVLYKENPFLGRCTGRRQKYTLDGTTYGSFQAFLEGALKMPLSQIMKEYYERQEMSAADMARFFSSLFGFPVAERNINHALKKSGVRARDNAQRKRLSWKQGKMDGALPKMRQTCKRTYMLGSKAESTVRYMLRQGLLILDAKWDAVIGDNLQHILERYEVDIPLVLVERESGRACRIAIEVDSAFTHSTLARQTCDKRKTRELIAAGWHVLRIDGDNLKSAETVAKEMTRLMLEVKRIAEEAFLNNHFHPQPLLERVLCVPSKL